jgi:outer membrane immunogenic protein
MNMGRLGVVAIGVVAQITSLPAFAADLAPSPNYVKAPAVVAAPVYNWTGFYVGVNAGYGWGSGTNPAISFGDPAAGLGTLFFFASGGNQYQNMTPRGVIGGSQIGYDWQTGNWVLGGVADFQGSAIKASSNPLVNLPRFNANIGEPLSAQINWIGTVRARLGVAQQNWLFYGTGGLAYGQVNSTMGNLIPAPGFPTFVMSGSQTSTKVGWVAGAGVEYKFSSNWSAGLEYLYFNLGSDTVTAIPVVNTLGVLPGTFFSANQKFGGNIARAMVNYRF